MPRSASNSNVINPAAWVSRYESTVVSWRRSVSSEGPPRITYMQSPAAVVLLIGVTKCISNSIVRTGTLLSQYDTGKDLETCPERPTYVCTTPPLTTSTNPL